MTLLWLLWVASGPLMLLMAAVLIECAVFIRSERPRADTVPGAVAIAACRRSARRSAWGLLVSLALPIGIWVATTGDPHIYVAFWVPWYYIVMGLVYPPMLFLPLGLIGGAALLTHYLLRAPRRWREAGVTPSTCLNRCSAPGPRSHRDGAGARALGTRGDLVLARVPRDAQSRRGRRPSPSLLLELRGELAEPLRDCPHRGHGRT